MNTNYLAVDTSGIAYRVVTASPSRPDAPCDVIPLDGLTHTTVPYKDLRPLRTEMDASMALDAARRAKNYDAAKSCEQALELLRLESKGFIPHFAVAMTLADVLARDAESRS